jgi:hypothetical protein
MSDSWLLNCNIENGLFPDESTVVIETQNAGDVSFFCPNDFIKDRKVQVAVLEQSAEDALIKLPAESALGSVFVVSKRLLREEQLV